MSARQMQWIHLLISDYRKNSVHTEFFISTSQTIGIPHRLQLNAYILRGESYEYTITTKNRRS